jgi:hypothetical protein
MPVALERLFDAMRSGLTDAGQWAGPWALPGLVVVVALLVIANRDKVVSPGGLIFLLAALVMAVMVRGMQLGRF